MTGSHELRRPRAITPLDPGDRWLREIVFQRAGAERSAGQAGQPNHGHLTTTRPTSTDGCGMAGHSYDVI